MAARSPAEAVLRNMEARQARALLPVAVRESRERWAARTALVLDPTAEQAFEEGFLTALRAAQIILTEERQQMRDRVEVGR